MHAPYSVMRRQRLRPITGFGDELYGDSGKYKVVFSEPARPIGPIPFGDAPSGAMQGPRYTTFDRLKAAKKLTDLVGPSPP